MTKKKNRAGMQSREHILQIDSLDDEKLLPVRVLEVGTSMRYDPSNPAEPRRLWPESKWSGTSKTLHGRRRKPERYNPRPVRDPLITGPNDLFIGKSRSKSQLECDVELATSAFYIKVKMPNGKPGLAGVTLMIDKATRSVLAMSVQERRTDPDIVSLIDKAHSALNDRHLRATFNFGSSRRTNLPWLSEAEHRRAATRGAARIVSISADSGTHRYRGLATASRRLGIILTETSNRTPIDGAIAERVYSKIVEHFVKKLPGQIGSWEDIPTSNLISVGDLEVLLDRWVAQVWQDVPASRPRDARNQWGPAGKSPEDPTRGRPQSRLLVSAHSSRELLPPR